MPNLQELGRALKPSGMIIVQGRGRIGPAGPNNTRGFNPDFQALADAPPPPGFTKLVTREDGALPHRQKAIPRPTFSADPIFEQRAISAYFQTPASSTSAFQRLRAPAPQPAGSGDTGAGTPGAPQGIQQSSIQPLLWPQIAMGDVKSINSYRQGIRHISEMEGRGKYNTNGNIGIALYDRSNGAVTLQVLGPAAGPGLPRKIIFEGPIGTITIPAGSTPIQIGNDVEEAVRDLVRRATGQNFPAKPSNFPGPDDYALVISLQRIIKEFTSCLSPSIYFVPAIQSSIRFSNTSIGSAPASSTWS